MTDRLRDIVFHAAARPEVLEAVRRIYDALQQAIDIRRPRCDASGRCCRFDEFGHRLYVTTIELAAFVAQVRPGGARGWDATGCVFQVAGLCSVHPHRPFGCRVFFCDPTAHDWQQQQYADFHRQIRQLHETLAVPYAYLEWRQALADLWPDLHLNARDARPNPRGSRPNTLDPRPNCPDPPANPPDERPIRVVRALNLLTTRPPAC